MTAATRSLAGLAISAVLGCGSSRPGTDDSAVARLCRAVGALACDQTEFECLDDIRPKHTRKAKMGCGAEDDAVLECTLSKPLVCTDTSKGPRTVSAADCKAEDAALLACLPSCGASAAAGGPRYFCFGGPLGDVTADCTSDCACSCTAGPKAGRQFSVEYCALTVTLSLLTDNCY